jgi:hypothetical protein
MELPINLEKCNTFVDATFFLKGLYNSKKKARKVISRLGQSKRLALTTAENHECESDPGQGGCIILHSPQCRREVKRWMKWRGYNESLDGFSLDRRDSYLATRELQSFCAPDIDVRAGNQEVKRV